MKARLHSRSDVVWRYLRRGARNRRHALRITADGGHDIFALCGTATDAYAPTREGWKGTANRAEQNALADLAECGRCAKRLTKQWGQIL